MLADILTIYCLIGLALLLRCFNLKSTVAAKVPRFLTPIRQRRRRQRYGDHYDLVCVSVTGINLLRV